MTLNTFFQDFPVAIGNTKKKGRGLKRTSPVFTIINKASFLVALPFSCLMVFLPLSVAADVDTKDPFMWMDSGQPAPKPETKYTGKYQAPAPAPEAPSVQTTVQGHGNCYYPDGRPVTLDFPNGPQMRNHPGYAGNAYDARRGYMAGDDGILRGIQDNPCSEIYRRGGETPESAAGWLHPDDIRRVNTLEERRIPIHQVGRYDPAENHLWYSDARTPLVDPSRQWNVSQGETLSAMLRRWGAEAGWTVVYQSQTDYIMQADSVIRGSFPQAAGEVIASFSRSTPPLMADFYSGNKVMVVRSSVEFDAR